jgi:hypothetical protein
MSSNNQHKPITTLLRIQQFPEIKLGIPHVETVKIFSSGFSFTLPKTNYDSYTRQKTSSRLQKTTDLLPVVTVSYFRQLKLAVDKTDVVCSEIGNKS